MSDPTLVVNYDCDQFVLSKFEPIRETMFPYLTNVEGLNLAALAFEKDVAMLSCCAS
jgi:hypothetical protein